MASARRAIASRVGPGIAGASGGTGLIGIAALLPDDYHVLKQLLTYISPTASIVFGVVWARVSELAIQRYNSWRIDSGLKKARRIRDDVLNNPHSTRAHKKQTQENVEKLERLAMEVINDQTQSVRATVAGSTHNPSDPT